VNAGNMVRGKVKMPARPGGAPAQPQIPLMPTQGVFRQKQWITWWLPLLLLLLVALLLLLYKLFATHNVVVPDVVGQKKAFDAQVVLNKSGLKLGETTPKVDDSKPAGSVLRQSVPPKKEVAKGSTVDVEIATGSGNVKVPSIVTLTAADADHALREKSLTLGTASPADADPASKIASQVPAPDEIVKAGTPINIFFSNPKKDPKKKGDPGSDTGKGGSGGKGGDGGKGGAAAADIAVPGIEKADTSETYSKKLGALGLVPVISRVFNDAKAGTPLSTTPGPGAKAAKGAKVGVVISAGQPEIVFTSGQSPNRNIRRINGASGAGFDAVASTDADESDPTWTADTQHVAFISNGQVMLRDISKKDAKALPLTNDGKIYADLAWAPTTDSNVLAMDQILDSGDSDLCLAKIESNNTDVSCITEPSFAVARAIHWAPDGRSILGLGVKEAGTFGIVRWKVKDPKKAFSSDASDWTKGHFVTDLPGNNKGVLDAAISPDGKRLALVSNIGTPDFRLVMADAGDFKLKKAVKTKQRACKVAWRSDSKALLLVQGAADCQEKASPLVRVDANATANGKALNASGTDPSFQPLTVGG